MRPWTHEPVLRQVFVVRKEESSRKKAQPRRSIIARSRFAGIWIQKFFTPSKESFNRLVERLCGDGGDGGEGGKGEGRFRTNKITGSNGSGHEARKGLP